jgi:thioredoxin reductase
VVVGAGDAAIENALALTRQNRVILINRNDEFTGCKDGNLSLGSAAIKDGKLELPLRHAPERVEAGQGPFPADLRVRDASGRRNH